MFKQIHIIACVQKVITVKSLIFPIIYLQMCHGQKLPTPSYTYIGFMADISIVVNEVDRPTYQLVK